MAIAARQVPGAEADQRERGGEPQPGHVDRRAGERDEHDRERDGGGVAERDRRQRLGHRGGAAALQPEPDREQPAHRRVDAVKQAEPGERQPRPQPGRAHDRVSRMRCSASDSEAVHR